MGLAGRECACLWEPRAESRPAVFAFGQSSCRCFPTLAAAGAGQGRQASAWQRALPCSLLMGGNRAVDDGNCKKLKRHANEEGTI